MKKRCCVLCITLVIMLGMGGCNNGAQHFPDQTNTQSFPTTEQPSLDQTETQSASAPSEYTESTLGGFHIALATDELLNKYDSFHEYISDEHITRVIIWTDINIKDFAFITIDSDVTGDKITYLAGDILFSVDELSLEKPFVAEILAPETLPINGISFLDESGVERYFFIQTSGRGAEEDPPYYFLEFKNGGGLLPTSPLSS